MTLEILDCEQGSDSWYAARAGIPTASEFHTVMARGKDGGASATRRTYMLKLAGEILTGDVAEGYSNAHMDRGREMEAEARDLYTFVNDEPLTLVGFIRSGQKGCSPDALVGDRGMVEFKTALPHILIDRLLRGDLPPEHRAQCQGNLWVAEREWIDLCVFWPKLPLFKVRTFRDDAYIAKLDAAVATFNNELAETVEAIRNYKRPLKAALVQSLAGAA